MRGSLKFQLMFAFNLVILMMMAVMGFALAFVMRGELLRQAEASMVASLTESSDMLDYFYSIYLAKSDTAFLDLEINAQLARQDLDLGGRIRVRREVLEKLARLISLDLKYPEVRSSYYFGGSTRIRVYVRNRALVDGVDFFSCDSLEDKAWYRDLMGSPQMFSWDPDEVLGGVPYVAFGRRMLDLETFEDIAVLKVLLPKARIRNILLQNQGSDVAAFVYSDDQFAPIAGGGAAEIQQDLIVALAEVARSPGRVVQVQSGGEDYLVSTVASDLTGWSLTYAVPKSLVLRSTQAIMAVIAVVCVLAICSCMLAATYISARITRRIGLLVQKTCRAGAGNLEVDEALRDIGSDEISQLNRAFDTMTQQIQVLHQKEIASRLRINEVRAELLQEQINPHLLYNTLSMIKLAARRDGQQETYQLAEGLVNFYKGVLNRGSLVAPIERELFMVHSFVETTCKVYDLHIDLRINVPAEVERLYAVKLFLQPLVENAVLHGIRPVGSGVLDISAELVGSSITIAVVDNGIGIDPELLAAMRTAMAGGEAEPGRYKGFGVLNVYKRIKLFFGEAGDMQIESHDGGGTTITLTIPAFTQEGITHWLDARQIGGI